jgi:hypothetical protein
MAQAGDTPRAAEIANQALAAAEAIRDDEWRASALSGVAQALAQAGDRAGLERVIRQAKFIKDERYKVSALRGVAQALAQAGDVAGLERIVAAAEAIRLRDIALSGVAQAMAQIGQHETARQHLRTAFTIARLARRASVFTVLGDAAPILAAVDQGQTLWRVYQAVQEVDGWWGIDSESE